MHRPRIRDLAAAAGVSVATVNRVLAGQSNVKPETATKIRNAASALGFYGAAAIRSRVAAARPKYRFGFLLHQPFRAFYRDIADALRAAAARQVEADIDTSIEFLGDLSPQSTAARMLALGETCDVVGVVAAVHPLVTRAVVELRNRGKPVFALVSQLADQVHYVGLDNWKVGRTAAWAFDNICKRPGKIAILVGNHRYRCQELNEAGFRSYFREHAPAFTLLEPLSTFETRAVAQEMTENVTRENPDLVGLFISGGGMSGAIAALRTAGLGSRIVVVGYELMDVTREALLDGTLKLLIAHPIRTLAEETIRRMLQVSASPEQSGTLTSVLPFEIYTRENL